MIRRVAQYIHHHYHKLESENWYDPSDNNDINHRLAHKGQRYCFLAAMVGPNPNIRGPLRGPEDEAHFLKDTLRIFKSESAKDVGDYHRNFHAANFTDWWTALLLPALAKLGGTFIIIMDNAKYHKSNGAQWKGGVSKMNKAALLSACAALNVVVPPNSTNDILKGLLKVALETLDPEVVRLAKAAGHTVLYSPPYHSDLQPIEQLWAWVKQRVARQYRADTTMEDVLVRLKRAFLDELPATLVGNCIKHAWRVADRLRKEDAADEAEDEAEHSATGVGVGGGAGHEGAAAVDDGSDEDADEWDSSTPSDDEAEHAVFGSASESDVSEDE